MTKWCGPARGTSAALSASAPQQPRILDCMSSYVRPAATASPSRRSNQTHSRRRRTEPSVGSWLPSDVDARLCVVAALLVCADGARDRSSQETPLRSFSRALFPSQSTCVRGSLRLREERVHSDAPSRTWKAPSRAKPGVGAAVPPHIQANAGGRIASWHRWPSQYRQGCIAHEDLDAWRGTRRVSYGEPKSETLLGEIARESYSIVARVHILVMLPSQPEVTP